MTLPRVGTLCAAAALSLAAAAPASAGGPAPTPAPLHAAYDFPGGALDPSYVGQSGQGPAGPVELTQMGTLDASTEDFGPGTGSRGTRVAGAGEGLFLPSAAVPSPVNAPSTWSVTAFLDPADTAQILAVPGGKVRVDGGMLGWQTDAGVTTTSATPLPAGFQQITIRVEGSQARVFLGGTEVTGLGATTVTGGPRSVIVLAGTGGGGEVARVRTFNGPVDPAGLDPLDVTDPTVPTGIFSAFSMYTDGDGKPWVGPSSIATNADDDGTAPVEFRTSVTKVLDNSLVVAGATPLFTSAYAQNTELVSTFGQLLSAADIGALLDSREYRFTVTATDRVGQTGSGTATAWLDKVPPTGLTADFPSETTDRTPTLSGAAKVGPRDSTTVSGTVCRGECFSRGDGSAMVGFFTAEIVDGRWSTDELYTFGRRGFVATPVESVPLGEYTVSFNQSDRVNNFTAGTRTLKIVAPAAPGTPATPATTPVAPIPPTVATPQPTTPASPREVARRLLAAAIQAFRKETIRKFVKDGANVPFQSSGAGTAIVQVYEGSAPAAIASQRRRRAAKKPIAAGRRVFRAAGAGTIKVKLTAKAKRSLRRKRSAKLVVRTIWVPQGSPAVAADRRLTLKR